MTLPTQLHLPPYYTPTAIVVNKRTRTRTIDRTPVVPPSINLPYRLLPSFTYSTFRYACSWFFLPPKLNPIPFRKASLDCYDTLTLYVWIVSCALFVRCKRTYGCYVYTYENQLRANVAAYVFAILPVRTSSYLCNSNHTFRESNFRRLLYWHRLVCCKRHLYDMTCLADVSRSFISFGPRLAAV